MTSATFHSLVLIISLTDLTQMHYEPQPERRLNGSLPSGLGPLVALI